MSAIQPADLLVRNARVYTVDPGLPWSEAGAVQGDRIAWVGADSGADGWTPCVPPQLRRPQRLDEPPGDGDLRHRPRLGGSGVRPRAAGSGRGADGVRHRLRGHGDQPEGTGGAGRRATRLRPRSPVP